jgi:pimeloyl-ACP methyl ester carboxylesterase
VRTITKAFLFTLALGTAHVARADGTSTADRVGTPPGNVQGTGSAWAPDLDSGATEVSAVVYVAARAPDAGEDCTALAKKFPTPPASAGIVFDGDEGSLTETAFLRDFAGDLPEAQARVLYSVQQPFHKALLTGKARQAAWRTKPSFYAVSTEDRTINPDLERFLAKRMGATTIEVKSSHLSLISHPQEITDLILQAAGRR